MVSVEERLVRRLRKGIGCWEWVGAIGANGYGKIGVGKRTLSVHRVAFELWCGPIPKRFCVLHKCDNRICCKPSHLFLGTKADNSQDMAAKGRQVFQQHPERAPKGERNGSTKLTAMQVMVIKSLLSKGKSKRSLAKDFGVSRGTIQFIAQGRNWGTK